MNEKQKVKELGDYIGYGALMSFATECWSETLGKNDGVFKIGPCSSQTVSCDCIKPWECDWCCGCGWLTKRVKDMKDNHEI